MTGEARMCGPAENLAAARRYIEAIESGARGDEIAQFFAPEAVVEIFPSRFFPNGSRDELAGIRAAADRGNKAIIRQSMKSRMNCPAEIPSRWKLSGQALWPRRFSPSQREPRCAPTSRFCNSRMARFLSNAITTATIPDARRSKRSSGWRLAGPSCRLSSFLSSIYS